MIKTYQTWQQTSNTFTCVFNKESLWFEIYQNALSANIEIHEGIDCVAVVCFFVWACNAI